MKSGDPSKGCLLIKPVQQALCILSYNQLWIKNIFKKGIQKVPKRRSGLAARWHPTSCETALGVTSNLEVTRRVTRGRACTRQTPRSPTSYEGIERLRILVCESNQEPNSRAPHEGSPPL